MIVCANKPLRYNDSKIDKICILCAKVEGDSLLRSSMKEWVEFGVNIYIFNFCEHPVVLWDLSEYISSA